MVQTAVHNEEIRILKGKLFTIYEYLIEQHDKASAQKVKQLAQKLGKMEFVLAFCGHFSAGKSSMINRVVGENILPSSPIPTSANLVKVKSGEEYAKVFFKNEKPRLYLAPYDYELVKNYCKDGDQIEEIEISHRESRLPLNTIIMDTPGIDSAEDAHRIATESAIHLADLVFYVMDYNHVQSELNFLFTRELTEAGKEVYLVINQIDKHSEEELSFQEFLRSVNDSFASWGVKSVNFFYTSLKLEKHPYNQFSELQEFILQRLNEKDHYLLETIFQSLKKIVQDHINHSQKRDELRLLPFKKIINELSTSEQHHLSESYKKIRQDLEEIKDGYALADKEFNYEIDHILKNAYLMPFQTRASAEAYLEACQTEFKVGFLFSKQKTLEEREVRLSSFYQNMLEITKSQLEWHLREYLLGFLKEKRLENPDLLSKVQAFNTNFPIDLLVNTVKSGARLSGTYLLNYTDDVANEIKKVTKNHLFELKILLFGALKERNVVIQEKLDKEFKRMDRYVNAFKELEQLEAEKIREQNKIQELLKQTRFVEKDPYHLFDQIVEEFEVIYGKTPANDSPIQKIMPDSKSSETNNPFLLKQPDDRLYSTAGKLKKASHLVNSLPGFEKLAKELKEKANRLKNKGFTVALFGAFSAGKSSFANALIGKKVLPVSPNPTTAAINKIKPVNESHPHGTVLVKFKEANTMLEDVNRSLKVFDLQAENFDEALMKLDRIAQQRKESVLEKSSYAFLKAFEKGFDIFEKLLSKTLHITLSEFSKFVSIEEKSCFVEWIELYYDCDLTRKGITLVDTPGADSINARHTGVAFDFIKKADAILFVTYYNHAFSKADREFLIQLGRVKDSFHLDKMYFVINAIDLAENEEEKESVAEYVTEQLFKYGIRNPHLYSLSSLLALKEKNNQTKVTMSGMASFESAFYQFISNDLTGLAVAESENELNRVTKMVGKLIHSAKEDAAVKDQMRFVIDKQKAKIKGLIESQTVENLRKRLIHEAEELIYYIKQRVFHRFNDFFKEAFNPSVLRDDGRNIKKSLNTALEELLTSVGYELAQEMRATTVRLDRFTEKIIADFHSGLIEILLEMNQDLLFSAFDYKNKEELLFPTAFKEINQQLFSKAISHFKNPKSFFEKNEKKLMSEELYRVLDSPAEEYLLIEGKRLINCYTNGLELEFDHLKKQMTEQVEDFYTSMLSALDGGVSVQELIGIQQCLEKLLSDNE